MLHYVYIIYSRTHSIFYRGYSLSPMERVLQHNDNKGRYTKNKGPWELLFMQSYKTKTEALIRERSLKKYSKSQIRELISSPKNEL